MNKKLLILSILFTIKLLHAQTCTLYPVSLKDRIANSPIVIEGMVFDKKSYWNDEHTQILTAYFIEVFKVFKGNQVPDTVAIVVQGGQVGLDILKVNPGIKFNLGDYGIFILSDLTSDFINTGIVDSRPDVNFYRDYAWSQCFISIIEGKVHDVFFNYKDNKVEYLYQNIYDLVGNSE